MNFISLTIVYFIFFYLLIHLIVKFIESIRYKQIIDPNRIICPNCKYVFSINQKNAVLHNTFVIDKVTIEFKAKSMITDGGFISCIKCKKIFHFTRKNGKVVNSTVRNVKFLDKKF